MVNDLIVTRSIRLNADAPTVWKMLTDPGMIRQYMYNCEVCSDWRERSEITWRGNDGDKPVNHKGEIIELVPGRRFKYTTFDIHSGAEDNPSSYLHVTYDLVPRNGFTDLLVTISNFGGDDTRAEHAAASFDFEVLPKLKTLAEARHVAV